MNVKCKMRRQQGHEHNGQRVRGIWAISWRSGAKAAQVSVCGVSWRSWRTLSVLSICFWRVPGNLRYRSLPEWKCGMQACSLCIHENVFIWWDLIMSFQDIYRCPRTNTCRQSSLGGHQEETGVVLECFCEIGVLRELDFWHEKNSVGVDMWDCRDCCKRPLS